MPERLIPPGHQAVLVGSVESIEELAAFAPMEEGSAEGTLMLMRLDFAEFLPEETLIRSERACFEAGVEHWPGYGQVVYADVTRPSVYLAWQKGIVWMPIIIGILITTLLPPLLGGLVWLILPDSLKQLITSLIQMGMMMLVMWLMMSVIKPLTASERPKRIEEAKK
ncbi:MAG: hypothetical protein PHQ43_15340 [Dehalococcoidales bacterium]|nr:hypothetical protein [Dehalococcoidales bacterium]